LPTAMQNQRLMSRWWRKMRALLHISFLIVLHVHIHQLYLILFTQCFLWNLSF
jgi:hypothetical protein